MTCCVPHIPHGSTLGCWVAGKQLRMLHEAGDSRGWHRKDGRWLEADTDFKVEKASSGKSIKQIWEEENVQRTLCRQNKLVRSGIVRGNTTQKEANTRTQTPQKLRNRVRSIRDIFKLPEGTKSWHFPASHMEEFKQTLATDNKVSKRHYRLF